MEKTSNRYSIKVTATGYMFFNENADSGENAIDKVREYVMSNLLEHTDFEFTYEITESEVEDEETAIFQTEEKSKVE